MHDKSGNVPHTQLHVYAGADVLPRTPYTFCLNFPNLCDNFGKKLVSEIRKMSSDSGIHVLRHSNLLTRGFAYGSQRGLRLYTPAIFCSLNEGLDKLVMASVENMLLLCAYSLQKCF